MFGKKNPTCTPLDRMIMDKNQELIDAKTYLMSTAERVIIANGVIDLYPEGADKTRAIEDAEAHKHSLLCAIGAYDGRMQEYNELLKREGARETTTGWANKFSTSHKIIEIVYRNFWEK